MSDAFWTVLFGFLTVIATQVLQMVQANRREARQAEKVENVRTDLKVTTAATTEKLGEIHTLVNGARGDSLRSGATSARALFKLEPTEANRALMDKADRDLAAHEEAEAAIRGDMGRTYTHNTIMTPGGTRSPGDRA